MDARVLEKEFPILVTMNVVIPTEPRILDQNDLRAGYWTTGKLSLLKSPCTERDHESTTFISPVVVIRASAEWLQCK
jgi:hypothetical protein